MEHTPTVAKTSCNLLTNVISPGSLTLILVLYQGVSAGKPSRKLQSRSSMKEGDSYVCAIVDQDKVVKRCEG